MCGNLQKRSDIKREGKKIEMYKNVPIYFQFMFKGSKFVNVIFQSIPFFAFVSIQNTHIYKHIK